MASACDKPMINACLLLILKFFAFIIFVRKSNKPVKISIIPTNFIFPEKRNSIFSLSKKPTIPAGIIAIKIFIIYSLLFLSSLLIIPKNKPVISSLNTIMVLSAVAKCKTEVIRRFSEGNCSV